jgi:hypothetical protein
MDAPEINFLLITKIPELSNAKLQSKNLSYTLMQNTILCQCNAAIISGEG